MPSKFTSKRFFDIVEKRPMELKTIAIFTTHSAALKFWNNLLMKHPERQYIIQPRFVHCRGMYQLKDETTFRQ
jgi:hypothetical protein